jgi:type IV secretion system protein VirD4
MGTSGVAVARRRLARLWAFYEGRNYLGLGLMRRIGGKLDDLTARTGDPWFQRLAGVALVASAAMAGIGAAVLLCRGPVSAVLGDVPQEIGALLADRFNELSRHLLPLWNGLASTMGLKEGRALELDAGGGWMAAALVIAVFLTGGLIGRRVRSVWGSDADARRSRSKTYGSANWMATAEAARLYGAPAGMVIGHHGTPALPRRLLGYDGTSGTGQAMVFANTGAGKTAAVGIPTALLWSGSLVYLDPSGEVAAVAARHRRESGTDGAPRKIVILAPGGTDGINILDWIDPAREAEAVNKIQSVGQWFADPRARYGENAFFEHRAIGLIRCLVAGVIFDEELTAPERTIAEVYRRLTGGWDALLARLAQQAQWTHGCGYPGSEARLNLDEAEKVGKTFSNVLASAVSKMAWVADPLLAPLASGSSVRLAELPVGNVDIFINLRPRDLDAHPGCARALVGAMLNAIYERQGAGRPRTLFLLDEIAKLGRMGELSTAMFDGRKYGVSVLGLWQNIGQLRDLYGRELAIGWLGASQYIQFFGVGDVETAQLVEKLCGSYTAIERSVSQRGLGLDRRDRNQSRRQVARALIRADEVLALSRDRAVVFNKGLPPIRCTLARYYEHPALRALGDANPFVR